MTKSRKTILAIAIIFILLLAAAGTGYFYTYHAKNKFPLGTVVAGTDISGKKYEEAAGLLKEKEKEFLNKRFTITANGKTAKVSPKDLGVETYIEKTLKTVMDTDTSWGNTNSGMLYSIDTEKTKKLLDKEFSLSELLPKNANFYLENRQLKISEEKDGTKMDEEKFITEIGALTENFKTGNVTIILKKEQPQVTKELLEKEQDTLKEQLNSTIVLVDPVYSDDWTIKLSDYPNWINFVQKPELSFAQLFNDNETKNIHIEISQTELNKFIDEKISKWLDKPPSDVKIYKNSEGKFVIEGGGNDGMIIQRTLLKEAIELAIENKVRNVTIPVVTIMPKITPDAEALKLGIKDRLSVGHTSFYGSPANRVHNIKTGTNKFNGTLIAPGEIFSFNKTMGSVTAANGYKMELVIKPEGTIPEFGGGLCQVSTTTFRAALFAGLAIEERHQHTYAVTYYSQILGHGLDATIYEGGADLKFKNDTNNHILIQAYVDKDYELYFIFYGTEDGRQVTMEGPYISNSRGAGPTEYIETTELKKGEIKQKERAHAGFDALWYRYLTMPNGETTKEDIFSRYKAVPAKVLTGTAE